MLDAASTHATRAEWAPPENRTWQTRSSGGPDDDGRGRQSAYQRVDARRRGTKPLRGRVRVRFRSSERTSGARTSSSASVAFIAGSHGVHPTEVEAFGRRRNAQDRRGSSGLGLKTSRRSITRAARRQRRLVGATEFGACRSCGATHSASEPRIEHRTTPRSSRANDRVASAARAQHELDPARPIRRGAHVLARREEHAIAGADACLEEVETAGCEAFALDGEIERHRHLLSP